MSDRLREMADRPSSAPVLLNMRRAEVARELLDTRRTVRLLSSDDKVRSRFTQQGCTAHLTLSSACFLVAGAFQTDRDRIGFSHLHALLRLLAAFLSGLSNSAEPCPEVRGPMLWNQRPTRGARCSRKGLGPLGGRGTCEPGQERTWSRRKCDRRLGIGG